ncbi:MAG: AbrB family transcriptional regulator [Deltaproteobacteria bacterium RIFOXYD12_FULL_55_16]|nr:MAG: AbrB family transcriptional regulator [Deltaproteobacteria bacterium RIFOXYD12_FULL_55_16]
MRLQVAKWGNSLAVRLPVECTRLAGLKEGDSVEASITQTGEISLMPTRAFDKAAFLKRIAKLHASMPMTAPVIETMRQEASY